MENEILRELEKQFGKEWVCDCGGSFQIGRVKVASKGKNSILARYSCQVCGREQVFAVSLKVENGPGEASIVEAPSSLISSNDVLDIKKEAAEIKLAQIVRLEKKRKSRKVSAQRLVRPSPKF